MRQQANRRILDHLKEMVEKYPDLRFHQILQILNVVELDIKLDEFNRASSDKFYEESIHTLERIKKKND